MRTEWKRVVSCCLIVSVLGLGIIQPVQAALLSTAQAGSADGTEARERIAAALARPGMAARLQELGVSESDAQARIAALTDAEALAVADRIDHLPAGGIVGALVLIFLVLLVTDILGFTKVYPFTRPIKR